MSLHKHKNGFKKSIYELQAEVKKFRAIPYFFDKETYKDFDDPYYYLENQRWFWVFMQTCVIFYFVLAGYRPGLNVKLFPDILKTF